MSADLVFVLEMFDAKRSAAEKVADGSMVVAAAAARASLPVPTLRGPRPAAAPAPGTPVPDGDEQPLLGVAFQQLAAKITVQNDN